MGALRGKAAAWLSPAAILVCLAQPSDSQAQESGPVGASSPTSPTGNSPIIVTGTRIRMPEAAGIEPLFQLDRSYPDERNLPHFADALNESPGFRGSLTPDGAQSEFGQGVNFINAFGLGSQRTLTLVNGRRFVSSNGPTIFAGASPGTQVDLNAIPSILLDRVDRVAIGGAPTYGSDAIAATVNVVLRQRLQGIETRAMAGVSEEGDKFHWKLSAAGGQDFADGRGNITLAISFDRSDGVAAADRSFYRDNLAARPIPVPLSSPACAHHSEPRHFSARPAGRRRAMAGSIPISASMTA